MALGIALIIVIGLLFSWVFEKLKLPGLLGMILAGILVGPWCLDLLSEDILIVSDDFRKIALIIILLRAGLGLKKEKLAKVGPAAIRMSIIPCIMEGAAITYLATLILGMGWIEAGMLGFAVSAVSPAVVVPAMLEFSEKGIGSEKGIPTIILAGSSIDAILAITIFSGFISLYTAEKVNLTMGIANVVISIIIGAIIGVMVGLVLVWFFKKYHIRDTKKVLIILGTVILMTSMEDLLKGHLSISSLLGIMTVGFIILEKLPRVSERLAIKLGKIWILAEILLFVLVGAKVDITVIFKAGASGLIIIAVGLIIRSAGVILSLIKSGLNNKEKAFCIIAYLPKATVQAAVGAVPLALGVKGGELILAIAVLSIIITAPLGQIGIRLSAPRLLNHPEQSGDKT